MYVCMYVCMYKCLPTGYHTSCIPSLNICDCKEAFSNNIDDVIVLVCQHDYHLTHRKESVDTVKIIIKKN